ncbi:MAG: cadmium-translocating P-type ATPase [Clostridia bacterium]|nr:cadmium-translocating P-type ATPase [Clostridia bacterium]
MNKKQKKALVRILLSAALLLLLAVLPLGGVLRFAAYMVPYLIIGRDTLKKALRGIRKRQPFDEHFLMGLATVGAIALGEYVEGVAVMLFYQIGELFESYAVGKSRENIAALMDIRPDSANLETADGETQTVDPDDVPVGSVILVRPGEKIPLDGVILSGSSALDTSALTGESVPREVREGDEALSGCISMSGVLRIQTTRTFGESTASRILDLVENASSRKSRPEAFISRFARVYTPAVCISAAALAVLPPVILLILGRAPMFAQWLHRALTFLVISCPCALVISIPLTFFAGIGCASREGVLVKGSCYLEALSRVRTVVFDKTGTMTKGVFEVTEVFPAALNRDALLETAALCECHSRHPISQSLKSAYGKAIDAARVADVQEISGKGVTACVDGRMIACGNEKLMADLGIIVPETQSVVTLVHVAADGKYAGLIVISDRLKETAKEAVSLLRRAGVRRCVMLTGDTRKAAESIASELTISEVHSELLPEDKVDHVERLLSQSREGNLAFVGDGINDAPVLSRADVGIAMGALGSDAAIEAADVVLMDDDPRRIALSIRIARKCLSIVYQNIVFAIGVKFACLILGALGVTGMWAAIFADVGVLVLAILNAIRALRVPK